MTWPKKVADFVEYLWSTGLIFAFFIPYESALRADDGSVAYFPICQGIVPWQPNNIGVMKAN